MTNVATARPILLRAENIKKSFFKGKTEVPVLRGVDLQIAEGETISITGPSGAGKSTLLHILGTLEEPTQGKILFGTNAIDLRKLSSNDLARFRNEKLGFVFQFHYLLPEFSALENVMMPGLIAGRPRSEVEKQAKELLGFVGLSHRLSHRPSELSGGEQQRVAIARAIVLKPKLLLADELTGNLDSTNTASVVDLLVNLNLKFGVTIILVTHDLVLAQKMRRNLQMRDGKII